MSAFRSALIAVALILASTAPIAAKTYRYVDENGTVHYTDQPPQKRSAPLPDPAPAPAPQRQDPSASPTLAPAPPAPQTPTQAAPTSRPSHSTPTPPAPAPPTPAGAAPQTMPAPAGPAPSAVAPERRDEATALAREMIELSGMDRSLEHLAEVGRETATTRIWRRGDVQRRWSTLMPLLRRDVLAKPATACVARHLGSGHGTPGPGHGTEMMAWLRSPLGAKIQKLEAGLATPEGRQAYRKFVIGLPDTKIQPARLEIVHRMAERSRMAEQQTELDASMRTAMGRVLGQSAEEDDDEDGRDRRATNEHNRFWAVTAMLFAYHDLTEAELQTYDRFDASPTGVWFTNTYWSCLRETVTATEQRLTEALKSRKTAGRPAPATR